METNMMAEEYFDFNNTAWQYTRDSCRRLHDG